MGLSTEKTDLDLILAQLILNNSGGSNTTVLGKCFNFNNLVNVPPSTINYLCFTTSATKVTTIKRLIFQSSQSSFLMTLRDGDTVFTGPTPLATGNNKNRNSLITSTANFNVYSSVSGASSFIHQTLFPDAYGSRSYEEEDTLFILKANTTYTIILQNNSLSTNNIYVTMDYDEV